MRSACPGLDRRVYIASRPRCLPALFSNNLNSVPILRFLDLTRTDPRARPLAPSLTLARVYTVQPLGLSHELVLLNGCYSVCRALQRLLLSF